MYHSIATKFKYSHNKRIQVINYKTYPSRITKRNKLFRTQITKIN